MIPKEGKLKTNLIYTRLGHVEHDGAKLIGILVIQ